MVERKSILRLWVFFVLRLRFACLFLFLLACLRRGNLLKTHILDLFGPILDPIGYRLDLDTYYDKQEIPVSLVISVPQLLPRDKSENTFD